MLRKEQGKCGRQEPSCLWSSEQQQQQIVHVENRSRASSERPHRGQAAFSLARRSSIWAQHGCIEPDLQMWFQVPGIARAFKCFMWELNYISQGGFTGQVVVAEDLVPKVLAN